MRGELTEKIQEISKQTIGRPITLSELRLIPYVQYIMVNEQKIDTRRINSEERRILHKWNKEGFIEGGTSEELSITKMFWNYICEVLFYSYVDYEP